MKLILNVYDRKPLARFVSSLLGIEAIYMGAPTFEYRIGGCTVTKEGNLEIPDGLAQSVLQDFYDTLAEAGYTPLKTPEANAEIANMIDNEIFGFACSGNIKALEEYLQRAGILPATCKRFGKEHSLIMGAFRNQQWGTVDWLWQHNVRPTAEEQAQINDYYQKMRLVMKMQNLIEE